MSVWDRVKDGLSAFFTLPVDDIQTRAAAPFEVNIPGLFPGRYANVWRHPTVRQALGVPAILRCVTLIANTAGALSMNGIRNGVTVPAQDRPRLIVRPNPLTTPRVFWRDSAYWSATYGEKWWWVAKRDPYDDSVMSLIPVPPYEVKVEEDPKDLRYPVITWRDKVIPNRDMILDTLLPDPDRPYRGIGPLQLCGAAVSAAVAADEWAANFYAEGGYPSIYARMEQDFDSEDDATKWKEKWVSNPKNTPLALVGAEEVGSIPVDEQGAQMLNARVHNFGEAALMFGIPGSMVEYVQSGSSLTYQNVGQRFDDFVKGCLWPNYLEGSEQAMTDLLPRTWVAEFDTDRFTRPDPKTRMEIHQIAITAGVYDTEYAQRAEGIIPGSIETAPIPPAPPQAVPPIQARSGEPVRCDGMRTIRRSGITSLQPCGKLLAEAGPFVGRCPRCKKEYRAIAA